MKSTILTLQSAFDLKRIIYACGFADLLVFVLLIPLSYGIAVVSPFGKPETQEIAVLQHLAEPFEILGHRPAEAVRECLSGNSVFADRAIRTIIYALLLFVSTILYLFLVFTLRRNATLINEQVISLLFKMSVSFAVVNLFIYPMFTQDFWLSVAWGRMIVEGQNPYYQFFTTEALAGLPLLDFPIRMTYGPLWAIISAGLAFLSQRNVVLEFFAFKLVLALFWILSLGIIRKILVDSHPIRRALAICLFGWLPLSFHLTIGEGHNDIAMVFFLLLWMYLRTRSQALLSPLVLTASALIKYVTLPLIALEVIHACWSRRMLTPPRYLAMLLLSVLFAVIAFAPFWRDLNFFNSVSEMQDWVWFTPAHAIQAVGKWLGIPGFGLLSKFVLPAFLVIVFTYIIRYLFSPEFPKLADLTLAVLCAILFTLVGHVWPWFIIWILAPAAVAKSSALLRVVTSVAMVGPFLHLYWLLASGWDNLEYGSMAFYGLVAGVILIMTYGNQLAGRAKKLIPQLAT